MLWGLSQLCPLKRCLLPFPSRYAELLADNRSFTADEKAFFEASAQHSYEEFRDKAALSRKMPIEDMQAVAQVGYASQSL